MIYGRTVLFLNRSNETNTNIKILPMYRKENIMKLKLCLRLMRHLGKAAVRPSEEWKLRTCNKFLK